MALDSRVPAFPSSPGSDLHHEGMSLREWYAGLALQGIVTATEGIGPRAADLAAERAFELADEMMRKIAGG